MANMVKERPSLMVYMLLSWLYYPDDIAWNRATRSMLISKYTPGYVSVIYIKLLMIMQRLY